MVKLFVECLSAEAILEESALHVCMLIESSIDNLYSFESDRKSYQTKAKNLIFNLHQNKVCICSQVLFVLIFH